MVSSASTWSIARAPATLSRGGADPLRKAAAGGVAEAVVDPVLQSTGAAADKHQTRAAAVPPGFRVRHRPDMVPRLGRVELIADHRPTGATVSLRLSSDRRRCIPGGRMEN